MIKVLKKTLTAECERIVQNRAFLYENIQSPRLPPYARLKDTVCIWTIVIHSNQRALGGCRHVKYISKLVHFRLKLFWFFRQASHIHRSGSTLVRRPGDSRGIAKCHSNQYVSLLEAIANGRVSYVLCRLRVMERFSGGFLVQFSFSGTDIEYLRNFDI